MKKQKRSKLKLINLKVSSRERKELNALAQKYMGGNLSAWLRYAGLRFDPKKNRRAA